MASDMERYTALYKSLKIGIYLIFITPLLAWPDLYYYFETTKGFFLMAVSEILAALLLWFLYLVPQRRPALNKIDIFFLSFVGVVLLTSIFGVDPSYSFWADVDRMTGGLMWIHLVLIYLALIILLKTKQDWMRVLSFSVVVAIVMVIYHFLTRFGFFDVTLNRNGSFIGNSSYFGIYLVFHVFFSLLLVLKNSIKKIQKVGFIGLIACVAALFSLQAYSAIYSFFGGIFLLVVLLLIFRGKRWQPFLGWSLLFMTVVLSSLALFMLFIPNSTVQNKLTEIASGSRIVLWDIAWKGIKERPLFGWGLENFPTVFLKHYNACFGSTPCGLEMWFDRAHNKLLDVLVESGLVGLLVYLGVFFTAAIKLWRKCRSMICGFVPPILLSLLAIYFVQNLTNPDVAITLFLFVFLIAFISSFCQDNFLEDKSDAESSNNHKKIPVLVPIFSSIVFPIIFFFFVVQPFRGVKAILAAELARDPYVHTEAFERAAHLSPLGRDTRRLYLGQLSIQWLLEQPRDQNFLELAYLSDEIRHVESALLDSLIQRPKDLRVLVELAMLLQTKGYLMDPKYFGEAEGYLEMAIQNYPTHQQPLWSLASVYLSQDKAEQAMMLTQRAIQLNQEVFQSHLYNFLVKKFLNDPDELKHDADEINEIFPNRRDTVAKLLALDIQLATKTILFTFHPRFK